MKKQILISALKQFFYTLYLHLRYQLFYSHWQLAIFSSAVRLQYFVISVLLHLQNYSI